MKRIHCAVGVMALLVATGGCSRDAEAGPPALDRLTPELVGVAMLSPNSPAESQDSKGYAVGIQRDGSIRALRTVGYHDAQVIQARDGFHFSGASASYRLNAQGLTTMKASAANQTDSGIFTRANGDVLHWFNLGARPNGTAYDFTLQRVRNASVTTARIPVMAFAVADCAAGPMLLGFDYQGDSMRSDRTLYRVDPETLKATRVVSWTPKVPIGDDLEMVAPCADNQITYIDSRYGRGSGTEFDKDFTGRTVTTINATTGKRTERVLRDAQGHFLPDEPSFPGAMSRVGNTLYWATSVGKVYAADVTTGRGRLAFKVPVDDPSRTQKAYRLDGTILTAITWVPAKGDDASFARYDVATGRTVLAPITVRGLDGLATGDGLSLTGVTSVQPSQNQRKTLTDPGSAPDRR